MEIGFKLYYKDRAEYIARSDLQATMDGNAAVYKTTVGEACVVWRFEPYEGGQLISFSISAEKPLGIRRIDSAVFTVDSLEKTDRIVLLGRDKNNNETRYPSELMEEREYRVNCVGKVSDLQAPGILVAGVVPFCDIYVSTACRKTDGSVVFSAATEFTEEQLLACSLRTEQVYLRENVTVNDFLTAYRKLLPKSAFDMPKLTGWNSWDYYLDKVTSEDVAENVAALKDMPFAKELDYIVIDDGWQKGWGDWKENEKFSCGLSAVANNIREAGFIPGIWMAPLGVKEDTEVFALHPEWFCKNLDGELLFDMDLYYLDPTHPEAEAFILDCYRYQYESGYRLFKMDYVSPLLKVKRFYDKEATPYRVLSKLVSRVKECTGPDAVILGCSLPPECGADIAPSMRIGVDIHNYFPHVVWIAQSLSWSWMYNNKITRIDADFMVVRGEETSNEPLIWPGGERNDFLPPPRHLQTDQDCLRSHWMHGNQFTAIEAETWANLVAISGGNIFLSDRMSVLNDRGISIIRNAMAIAGDEVHPVYQSDDQRLPSAWQGDKALLLINWEDVPRKVSFSGLKRPITSDKPYVLEGDTITALLLPHESFVAKF